MPSLAAKDRYSAEVVQLLCNFLDGIAQHYVTSPNPPCGPCLGLLGNLLPAEVCSQRKFGNGIGPFQQSFFPASNQNAHSRRERNAEHFAGIDPVLVIDAYELGPATVSSVEGGIRAAHRRGECDCQDLGIPHSGRWNVRPMRTPSESRQGYAQVPGEMDVLLCQQCPN